MKTLNHDCARISILTDAGTTMALLPGWFDDYSALQSHSGLRILSPRELRTLSA